MRRGGAPSGRVVVLGGVSPDEGCGSSPALLMMVLVGGRDRSVAEFRELARAGRVGRAGRPASTVGPLCHRVPPDVLTKASLHVPRFAVAHNMKSPPLELLLQVFHEAQEEVHENT